MYLHFCNTKSSIFSFSFKDLSKLYYIFIIYIYIFIDVHKTVASFGGGSWEICSLK